MNISNPVGDYWNYYSDKSLQYKQPQKTKILTHTLVYSSEQYKKDIKRLKQYIIPGELYLLDLLDNDLSNGEDSLGMFVSFNKPEGMFSCMVANENPNWSCSDRRKVFNYEKNYGFSAIVDIIECKFLIKKELITFPFFLPCFYNEHEEYSSSQEKYAFGFGRANNPHENCSYNPFESKIKVISKDFLTKDTSKERYVDVVKRLRPLNQKLTGQFS